MARIKIGCTVHPQQSTYAKMRQTWLDVEALGADSLWTWDHFYPLYGDPDGMHFEGYSLLAAMAEVTHSIPFGMLVTCNSYRNPNLLADMARTVDHISGGRHIFGIGAGWFERDYEEYGYDFGTGPDRVRALDEAMPVIIDRLSKLNPGPVNGKLPIMIGGSGPKVTMRIAAQYADMWNGGGTPDEMASKNGILDDWCAKMGRDPSQIERTLLRTDENLVEDAEEFVRAGVTHFIIGARGPEFDLDLVRRMIAWRDARD